MAKLGIICAVCESAETEVIDSRAGLNYIRRRRRCVKCGHRFTTNERDSCSKVNRDFFNIKRMRRLRAEGKTLKEVSELMGVAISTVWNKENGY